MSKYLVTLTPTGKFFFGGDMTFKSDRKNDNEKFSSYIIHSSMMPQQTSLLGMMRFLLLSNNSNVFDLAGNCIKKDKDKEVEDLIGKRSFEVSDSHSDGDFGKIVCLGACFLYNKIDKTNKRSYFKAGMDAELNLDFDTLTKACINGEEMSIPEIKVKARMGKKDEDPRYSGKDWLEPSYVSLEGDSIKESELFIRDSRIGIDKNYGGKADDSAFYKQISYRLKENFCFAFEVEVKNNTDLTACNQQLVRLGADASNFVFEAESLDTDLNYPRNEDRLRVVLVSDSYICKPKNEVKNECEWKWKVRYEVTQVRPFRFLSTSNRVDPKDYNMKYRTFRSEKRYDLYQAGSVFYFETETDKDNFCKIIDCFKEFKQIGYNKYR